MKSSEVLKVLFMLLLAIMGVAVLCYATVDIGMNLEQLIAKVKGWNSNLIGIGFLVWSVAITMYIANRLAVKR